jgi:hypothetical protein
MTNQLNFQLVMPPLLILDSRVTSPNRFFCNMCSKKTTFYLCFFDHAMYILLNKLTEMSVQFSVMPHPVRIAVVSITLYGLFSWS